MKKISQFLTAISLFIFLLPCANASMSPVGYWKTIDDVTGKPRGVLHIFLSRNMLYGKIVKIFPSPGHDEKEICKACTGYRHNKPILGMVIMEGLKQSTDNPVEWSNGQILDPLNGKTYRVALTVINQGRVIKARGYIGISLFGRTQNWIRVPEPESHA